MSLQDLELSPFLISELYKDTLVAVEGQATAKASASTKSRPPGEMGGYVPADTAALGLPPVTTKPPVSAIETPMFAEPEQQPAKKRTEKLPVQPQNQETSQRTIKYLGGNKKRVAFIVNCKTDVFLPEKHLDWLGKMLEACHLNLGDVAIANIANNQFTITDIRNELHSAAVILLGTEPQAIQLPLNFPHFNLQAFDDATFLYTPSPDQMNQQTNEAKLLKSKLWVCLQKLFKL